MTNLDERIAQLQKRFDDLGIVDIKISISRDKPLSKVSANDFTTSVLDLFESYLDGNYTVLPEFNDSMARLDDSTHQLVECRET